MSGRQVFRSPVMAYESEHLYRWRQMPYPWEDAHIVVVGGARWNPRGPHLPMQEEKEGVREDDPALLPLSAGSARAQYSKSIRSNRLVSIPVLGQPTNGGARGRRLATLLHRTCTRCGDARDALQASFAARRPAR